MRMSYVVSTTYIDKDRSERLQEAILFRYRTTAVVLALLLGGLIPAWADPPPIRIGDISSYSALPIGTKGYRQGWELARDQINAKGGVLGRKLEIIARDDAGKPDVAITQAVQLVDSEKVDLLTGGILSHVGLALADFAKQKKIYFMASQPHRRHHLGKG